MFRKNNRKVNKRGQVFIISVVIAVTLALTSAYFLLSYLYEPKNDKEFLGSYQSGIIDSLADGDKTLLYVDQAANMAVSQALEEYFNGNPNTLSGEDASEDTRNYCGSYVYRLWNSETQDCYPEYSNSQTFELNTLINKHLTALNYLQPKYINSESPVYVDNVLKQSISYDYTYDANYLYTNVYGHTNNKYSLNIFRDANARNDPSITNYLQAKGTYSGDLAWPLPNNKYVESCFGYRGDVGPGASTTHSGLDIPADINTPVLAAAPGIVTQILSSTWGKVIIDHGGGLSTGYIHMNKIADGLKVGDTVTQGQIIGYVGGRGPKSANDYGYHLHFDVMSTTVNTDVKYKGVSGIVKGSSGTNYVNPICFIKNDASSSSTQDNSQSTSGAGGTGTSSQQINQITFNMNSKACNSMCSPDGNCPSLKTDEILGGTPYKFCSLYSGVTASDIACPKSNNADWEINDVQLSSTSLTGDQTLKITMTIANKGSVCVNIKQKPSFTSSSDPSDALNKIESKGTNVYKSTDQAAYTTIDVLTCTFSSDSTLVSKAQAAGQCVLWAPSDNTEATYTLNPHAIDYNNKIKDYTSKKIQFTVKKSVAAATAAASASANANSVAGSVNGANSAGGSSSKIQLTKSEQAKVDKTKTNLQNLGAMPYIDAASVKYGIPKEILLGKITQESVGVNYKIGLDKTPPNRAIGISQVEGWQHYDAIYKTCGKDYISECSTCTKCDLTKPMTDSCQKDLKNCCAFTKFGSDVSCQVNVGAEILKESYNDYSNNDKAYSSMVMRNCKNPTYQQKYLAYTGWERALRGYNGFGCSDENALYNTLVTTYAAGWNNGIAYTGMIQSDANIGIFGTYYITPAFNVKINFDMRLFNVLQQFAKDTIVKCGVEGEDKKTCVQDRIDTFNLNLATEYIDNGVYLTMKCDENTKVAAINSLIEQINNCAASSDNTCNCDIASATGVASTNLDEIKSSDAFTTFKYHSGNDARTAYLDYNITKDGKAWYGSGINGVSTDSVKLYKDKDGKLVLGQLKGDDAKKCTPVTNKFRLCLKTGYEYTTYNGAASSNAKIITKEIIIPFAILVRDQVAPKPVSGITYTNLDHTKNSIALVWNKNKEVDVAKYNLYLSDDVKVFERPISTLKQDITPISVNSNPKNYIEYKYIDLANPSCKIQNSGSANNNNLGAAGTGSGIDYCVFEYGAIAKDGTTVKIELKPRTLYYMSEQNKFLYILDGSDTSLGLSSGKEKFVAITAVDIDGNEIDNVKDGQNTNIITLGTNLISITPVDKLEAGFAKITSAQLTDNNKGLTVSWNAVKNYIDGTPIDSSVNIKYSFIMSQGESCSDGFSEHPYLTGTPQEFSTPEGNIDVSHSDSGDYCLTLITNTDNIRGFSGTLFLKSLTIPPKS